MKPKNLFFIILLSMLIPACTGPASQREILFNDNWKFFRADVENGQDPGIDDSAWRTVDLPHDYSIEDLPLEDGVKQIGPFSEKSAGGASTGHVVGGTAWYRKHFTLGKEDIGKIVSVLFDGVYMDADIWINGNHLGKHPYGYTPFYYDLTPHLNPAGQPNLLAVQVKNEGKNSRWYSGSGIYRDVKLIKTQPVHAGIWGTYISTPVVSDEKATVKSETWVENGSDDEKEVELEVILKKDPGEVVVSAQRKVVIPGGEKQLVTLETEVTNPSLWSPENPALYTMEIVVKEGTKVLDAIQREIRDPQHFFFGGRRIFAQRKEYVVKGWMPAP